MIRRLLRARRASVVIVALSLIVMFAMMAAALGFRGGLEAKLIGRELDLFRERYLALGAVTAVQYMVEKDEDAETDHPGDDWYGEPDWPEEIEFPEGVTVTVSDEEGKINMNYASEAMLKALFEVIGEEKKLKTDVDDLAAAVLAWRGDGSAGGGVSLGKDYKAAPFESIDELMLIKAIEPEDVPRIRPFLTVYGIGAKNFVKVNPNTASEVVLEALVRSLAGDESMKDDLVSALRDWKLRAGEAALEENEESEEDVVEETVVVENAEGEPEEQSTASASSVYFLKQDLEDPGLFHAKIELSNVDPLMQALTTQFIGYLTTDSKFFRIDVDILEHESSKGTRVEAVVGYPVPTTGLQQTQTAARLGRASRRTAALVRTEMTVLSWKRL